MATSNVRLSVIGIVNEVQRKLGVDPTTTLTKNKQTTVLLDMLNDTIIECSDFDDWQEMYREVDVTASSSVAAYEIDASAEVKRVFEIVFDGDAASMEVRNIEDIRRLQRITSFGQPRQFAIVGVSGVNMLFRPYPVPGSNQNNKTFNVAFYKQPNLLLTTDVSAIPAFPSRVLVAGLYSKALLEETGGAPTTQYQAALAVYVRTRKEAVNRYNADTGTDTYFYPMGKNSRRG